MLKTIHYVFVFTSIIFLGVILVLYSDQRRLSVRFENLIIKFSEATLSSSTLKENATILQFANNENITKQAGPSATSRSIQSSGDETQNQPTIEAKNDDDGNIAWVGSTYYEGTKYTKRKISPEIFNKDSPFYGMLYKDEYGSPIKNRPQVETYQISQNEWGIWKSYFPELMLNFQKLRKNNPTLKKAFFTHSASVNFERTSYNLGEEFLATITSQDWEQRLKKFGGDYYRARLLRKRNNEAIDGIPCKVVDNCDGTYIVTAPLLLEGPLTLEVKLVNSVEAIREIVMKTEQLVTWKMRFMAKLESGEVVTCNVQLSNRPVNSN